MIFLLGDFPAWLPIFTLVGGVTTALTIAIAAAATAAAAGGAAYSIQSAVEGNWPWEDPEAWATGFLKANTGGLGQVISSAQGEPTIMEQLKGEAGGTSRGGGTAGVLQGATGQGINRAVDEALVPGPSTQGALQQQPQPMGGQAMGAEGGGGAGRYDAMDAEDEGPSRGKILGQAWKDIGIGAGTTAASIAIPYAGSLISPAASPAAQITSNLAKVAPKAADVAIPAVGAVGAKAAPSFLSTAADAFRVVPETIGTTATGVLHKSLLGAGLGAASSALQGQDPLRGAAMGGAGGVVGGVAGYGAQQFAPPPVPTIAANPFPMPDINAPSFVGGTAPGAPTLTSSLTSRLPSLLGSGASQGVGYMMTPSQPSQPGEPVYSARPSYYDVYDIGGPNAAYGGRRPYWG
jgi:hypothetical protein